MPLDLFLSLCKGKHKRDKWVLSALGHLLISISLAGGWASNEKSSSEGARFVRSKCFWTWELILRYCMDDWCFPSESTGAPVKFLRSSGIGTMIVLAPLVLLWIGFMLQICAMSKMDVLTIPEISKSLSLRQHHLNRLREKTFRWWTSFFCVHHLCLQRTNQHTNLFILGERLNSFLCLSIKIFWAEEKIQIKLVCKQRREFIGSGKRICRSAASFRQGWDQSSSYFCRTPPLCPALCWLHSLTVWPRSWPQAAVADTLPVW